jgi:hypothetical protein
MVGHHLLLIGESGSYVMSVNVCCYIRYHGTVIICCRQILGSKSYGGLPVAMVMVLKRPQFLYPALWKQCAETIGCSLIHGLLCTCTFIQRSSVYVYLLTLRSFCN